MHIQVSVNTCLPYTGHRHNFERGEEGEGLSERACKCDAYFKMHHYMAVYSHNTSLKSGGLTPPKPTDPHTLATCTLIVSSGTAWEGKVDNT